MTPNQEHYKQLIELKLCEDYGDAGLLALETSCVTDADYELGYDHVLSMILPALEEELLRGED